MRPIYPNKKNTIYGYGFLAPSLAGVIIFIGIPFLDVVRRSFFDAVGNSFVGISNYHAIFHNEAFLLAAKNTLMFMAVCIPLLLLLSLLSALAVSGTGRYQSLVKTGFLIPMAIPVASVVLFWRLFFDKEGALNQLLSEFFKSETDWMNSSSAFGVLVFSYLWKNIGYDMILWCAGLLSVPLSVYEAAKIDGAGKIQCFYYITRPALRPYGVMIGILSVINGFKVFREAWLVAGNYPHQSIYMLQHVFNNWFLKLDMQKMSAAAVITAVVISCMMISVQRINEKQEQDL